MTDLKIYINIDDLLIALAEEIVLEAAESIEARGRFNFVLSGGSSPKKLYELLASESFKHKINWNKTYFFFGDERFVSKNDLQRNSLMAKKALFEPLKIEDSHIFELNTMGTPEEAAQKYTTAIENHFHTEPIEFDFIILGLGENAHTASLFPTTTILAETEAAVKSVFVKELDTYRISMTAPLINQAKRIAFLVFGKDKAEAVYEVLQSKEGTTNQFPARLIDTENSKVSWFLDTDAASLLKK